jgi:predicted metallopeptidase
MALEFARAEELEKICRRIIENFYPSLESADIVVVYRSKTFPDSPATCARIEKISGLRAWLWTERSGEQETFFLIQIVVPNWETLSAAQQVAILDHELCHIEVSETTAELVLRDHAIEEFPEIVERHGAWHEGLQIFGEALERGESDKDSRAELIDRLLNG